MTSLGLYEASINGSVLEIVILPLDGQVMIKGYCIKHMI